MQTKQKYTEEELMGSVKVSTAVRKMAIPSVISSLVTVLYNMADTFFVGQTGDSLEVAAVSLTNPCFVLMMAVANMLGMGGAALASAALGAGSKEKARKVTSFVFWACIGFGLIFTLLFLALTNPILRLLGADQETIGKAAGYLRWIAPGAPFCIWSVAASFIVRGVGFSTEAMTGNMIGTILNIILDPIFISVFHQGAAGAAIATSISNAVASAYYIWFFVKKCRSVSISPKYFTLDPSISLRTMATGLPTGMFSALMSLSTILMNQIMTQWGNSAVAAIGIVFKANMFVSFVQMGIANGVQPLLGYSYGAGKQKRFREVERYTTKVLIITGVICTALYLIFRNQIISVFIDDAQVIRLGVPMLVAYTVSGPVIGLFFLDMDCLQSTEQALPATILSVLRNGALLIPLMYLLKGLFGFYGVISAQAVTDFAVIALAVIFWRKARKNMEARGIAQK